MGRRSHDDRHTDGRGAPPGPAGAGDAEERELNPAELAAVEDLVRRARTAGIALTGPDGLLKAMTKTVIEAALEEEIADHLGYDKHAVEGRNRANSRNGKRSKQERCKWLYRPDGQEESR